MIHGHGNNLYHFDKGAIRADFSSNIAFNNKSRRIMEHLRDKLELIQNYPDPETRELRELLAAKHQLSPDNILVCNGSAESFYLLAHYIASKHEVARSHIFTPSFAEYEDSCQLFKHQLSYSDLSGFSQMDLSGIHSVWLGCPNNPDGTRLRDEDITAQCRANPQCHFIFDCAYHELSTTSELASAHLDNQIITHSLTKSFGIPGIRLGYIIATASTIAELQGMRAPWSVNALSLDAGKFILQNYEELMFDHDELMAESQFLQAELRAIDGISVTPSACNFFLCELTDGRNATQLQDYLILEHGLLIRHAGNFRGLSENHFRIAAQSRDKNLQLINALRTWSSHPH